MLHHRVDCVLCGVALRLLVIAAAGKVASCPRVRYSGSSVLVAVLLDERGFRHDGEHEF